jgi:hypothetical protein
MYQLFRSATTRELLRQQAPTLLVSLLIAELLYKFHSFTLECVLFLATWFVLDAAWRAVRGQVAGLRAVAKGE